MNIELDHENNEVNELLNFLGDYSIEFKKNKEKLPYHINLLDELRANENAHSRILQKLLQQQDPRNNQFEILQSFLNFIIEKYTDKEDFQKIKIENPQITQEFKRIDLWIRDGHKYAIIIENKVHNAKDQIANNGGQLKRYIDINIQDGFHPEQIYVLYLPPTYEKEPLIESWGNYANSDIYLNRFLTISFKDDILPWLKNKVLPEVRIKDKYLISAIEQYIDHLEGVFSLRLINKKMNMELQEYLKNKLKLNELQPEIALKEIISKKEEAQSLMNQFDELENALIQDFFISWKHNLELDFPNYKIVGNWTESSNILNIGILVKQNEYVFSILIEHNKNGQVYYGMGRHYASESIHAELDFSNIIDTLNLKTVNGHGWWYAWEYSSFTDGYNSLRELILAILDKQSIQ